MAKALKKFLSVCMAVALCLSCVPAAFAAPVEDAGIDTSRKGSMTVYKYDLTNAEKDGVWDSSYVSTGVMDQTGVVDVLGGNAHANLGNGEQSYGYAIKGVEFTYLKIADIVQYSQSDADKQLTLLYGINKTAGADFLAALGLSGGAKRYIGADSLDAARYFYQSDVLVDALSNGLKANATTVKNALEAYITANGGVRMPLTDAYGKTTASDMELGLYLVMETRVPEMVVSTVDPFLVSLPMTSVNGTNATDGGAAWLYDVALFPKNLTGIPSLEKTLREQVSDTGKNGGSATDITDGYAHTGTASDGDVLDYQIISTLPSITSEATFLSAYTFVDTLSAGLSYNKKDVKLQFFSDAACTNLVSSWAESDGKFRVSYGTTDKGASVMTIEMTEDGLKEINASRAVYTDASMINSGFSDCTLRITYRATMHSDKSVVYGDNGNPNEVVLLWKRSNQAYFDTLVDDAHIYTYGLDVTKIFSDAKGSFQNVTFLIQNQTDDYYVKAELNQAEGVYYVTDHVDRENATQFTPVGSGSDGKIILKGLEEDTYILTETKTDSGYTLLRESISVEISRTESEALCDIYAADVLGLVQNDPRYATGTVNAPAQKHLEHRLLTASATVDGKAVTMLADNGSANAEVPLTVVNTRGFDLPQTGDHGTWMYSVGGVLMMAISAAAIFFIARGRKKAAG